MAESLITVWFSISNLSIYPYNTVASELIYLFSSVEFIFDIVY